MSQEDLDFIQAKLKIAIKNHQTLVEKLNKDPENQWMRTKLRELQVEIMSLSEKQKRIVQNLRKEIIQKQPNTLSVAKVLPVKQEQFFMSQTQTLPLTKETTSLSIPVNIVPIATATLQKSSPLPNKKNEIKNYSPLEESKTIVSVYRKNNVLNVPVKRCNSPLIRVPQFNINSTILQCKGICTTKMIKPSEVDYSLNVDQETEEKRLISSSDTQKIQYMAALDLVTPETLKEFQSKRTERKRRSTANPQFSYSFEPEKKNRVNGYMLNNLSSGVKRGRGRPPKHAPSPMNSRPVSPNIHHAFDTSCFKNLNQIEEQEIVCAICGTEGQVLQCNSCYKVFHMECLDPPLSSIPTAYWCCHNCQTNGKSLTSNGAESMTVVNSYIATKTIKEDEKRKLEKRSTELIGEKSLLQAKSKELTEKLTKKMKSNKELAENNKQTKQNVDHLSRFIKSFKNVI